MSISDVHDAQELWSMGILMRTGVFTNCRIHEDAVFDGGNDVDAAYKYANAIFTNNSDDTPFEDRTEMTDSIKSVFEEYCGCDSCPSCESNF
ncbi:hypothetical protein [Serratia sp. Je.1.23.a]|uniref:hypothetical protein n=1 Tax=Serratia sp. Je.1.23.a TaxID=3142841 RepID=UPI003DAA039B